MNFDLQNLARSQQHSNFHPNKKIVRESENKKRFLIKMKILALDHNTLVESILGNVAQFPRSVQREKPAQWRAFR